jgi:CelD/BcsL family acetyltransferase involved in cellulose biosynthesis
MIDATVLVPVMLMGVAYPGMSTGLRGELVEDVAALGSHVTAWDALAIAAGRPYCAPGWMLAWWRELAPPGARLRVALAFDGDELVGLAPCWSDSVPGPERLRFLAGRLSSPTGPLAPGREAELAPVLARTLAGARPPPRVIGFEGEPDDSPWPGLLAGAWPDARGVAVRTAAAVAAPLVRLDATGGAEEWLAGRSANFRAKVRQGRRRLAEGGASWRPLGEPDEIAAALPGLARLHHARRGPRGGSEVLDERGLRMLAAAADQLAPAGRLWISHYDGPDGPVAALLFVAAGGVASYWNGGFDDAWARCSPGLVALVAAIEEALRRDLREVDLGPGDQQYKSRVADEQRRLVSLSLRPRDSRYPLTAARLAPADLRALLARELSEAQKERIKRVLRRDGGRPSA